MHCCAWDKKGDGLEAEAVRGDMESPGARGIVYE